MINIVVKSRDGTPHPVKGRIGLSLMEAIRESGIDELLALCGGCCSCATCHVVIEEGPESLKRPQSEDEDDLLGSSNFREAGSRLACQLILPEGLDSLIARIALGD